MDTVIIKNGILLDKTDKYSVFEMYTDDVEQYYMCIANKAENNFEMVLDFPEAYFNSLLKDDKLSEIKKTCDNLFESETSYIYILPNVSSYEYEEAKTNNDDHSYQVLLRKLQKYTYNAYKSVTDSNNVKIDKTIDIIIDTDDDKKFMDYLDVTLNGYFKPIKLGRKIPINNEVEIITNDKEEILPTVKKENIKIRKLLKDNKGFSNVIYFASIITIIVIISVCVAYLMVK